MPVRVRICQIEVILIDSDYRNKNVNGSDWFAIFYSDRTLTDTGESQADDLESVKMFPAQKFPSAQAHSQDFPWLRSPLATPKLL